MESRVCPASFHWVGGTTGAAADTKWSVAANWEENAVPGNGDYVSVSDSISEKDIPVVPWSITVSGTGKLILVEPSLTLQGLQFLGGTVSGSTQITINGSLSWRDGTFTGGGGITIAQNAEARFGHDQTDMLDFQNELDGWNFFNFGHTRWKSLNGTLNLKNGASVTNEAGAVFSVNQSTSSQNLNGLIQDVGGGSGRFNNYGTFDSTSVSDLSQFNFATAVSSCVGSWQTNGTTTFQKSSDFAVSQMTCQSLNGSIIYGTAGSTFNFVDCNLSGDGTQSFQADSTEIAGTVVSTASLLKIEGTLTGSGVLDLGAGVARYKKGHLLGSGSIVVGACAELEIQHHGTVNATIQKSITNHGRITIESQAPMTLASNVRITNHVDATITINRVYVDTTDAVLTNQGTVIYRSADGHLRLKYEGNGILNQKKGNPQWKKASIDLNGTYLLHGNTLTVQEDFDLNGGSLYGSGTITATRLRNAGLIDFDDSGWAEADDMVSRFSTLNVVGIYEHSSTGLLRMRLGNNGQGDLLNVTGSTILGGYLDVAYLDFPSPSDLDARLLIQSSTPISGEFFLAQIPYYSLDLDYSIDPHQVWLILDGEGNPGPID